jgi:hypothetical protein
MPTECWSILRVYGPRHYVLAFKRSASGPGLGPFIPQVADELELIKLVDEGVGIQRAAKIVSNQIGYRISAPLRHNYWHWKKQIQLDLSKEQKRYSSALRKALKNPNLLDLNQLMPLPPEVSTLGTQALQDWRTEHWDTKWNTWRVSVAPIRRLPTGLARLQYSLMTAWGEPVGAIANASKNHRVLCFVLAGIEVSNAAFTSHFIFRGRVRSWQMPEKVWRKYAEMEMDGEDEYLADYQPRIMRELVNHWEEAALARLERINNGNREAHGRT